MGMIPLKVKETKAHRSDAAPWYPSHRSASGGGGFVRTCVRITNCYALFDRLCLETREQKMKNKILNPVSMFVIGLLLGVASRLFDIYTENLGNIFSQMAIWILFGVLISIYSKSKAKAMVNILPFCIGMLITYYFVAFLSKGVYSTIFIIGWTVFALCSPIMAYFTWMAKEKGIFPKIISIGILAVSFLSSAVLFDRIRFYDIIINGIMAYFLFVKKIER